MEHLPLAADFRSLIFGGDLPSNDAATTALITNEEVLEVDQHSSGGHQSLDRGNIRAWVADGAAPGEHYVAVFNLGESDEDVTLLWSEVGISSVLEDVRDLWTHKSLGSPDRIHAHLRPHASILYRVTKAHGN